MLYDYQYTLTAVFLTLVIMLLNHQRKGYASETGKLFKCLLYGNLLTAVTDIVTFFTISYPECFPEWFLYLSNMIYLFMFSTEALGLTRYVTALIGRQDVNQANRHLFWFLTGLVTLALVTTPLTHAVIYFDAAKVYRHGPLMALIFLSPCAGAAFMIHDLLKFRKKFTNFQIMTDITAFLFILACSIVQRIIPRLEIGTIACAILLYILYIVFENPAYATFGQTVCLNWRSLQHELEGYAARNEDCSLVLIGTANHPENRSLEDISRFELLSDRMAERLIYAYGRRIFCIDNGKFVLILPAEVEEKTIVADIQELFASPLVLENESFQVPVLVRRVSFLSLYISEDFVTHFIESFKHFSVETLFGTDKFRDLLLEQHKTELAEDVAAQALQKNLFEFWYQPIYDLETGTFRSAEALLRVRDIYSGNIEALVSAAQQNHSITRIEEDVFEKICAFLASGATLGTTLQLVEVNVSTVHFMEKGTAMFYIGMMQKYGIRPEQINLEITESSVLSESKTVQENFRLLREFGVTFSVDDYGSGFASADYLYRLPISMVKVDKSLLWQAAKDSNALLVFESTMCLIKRLGKKIVVEGAEDENMLRLIRENGGDFVQGYYYSKPLPQEKFIAFLKEHS